MEPILKRKLFGNSLLFWINFLLLQWFFIRLYRNEDWTKKGILKYVIPLTGWKKDYIYLDPAGKIIVLTIILLLIILYIKINYELN